MNVTKNLRKCLAILISIATNSDNNNDKKCVDRDITIDDVQKTNDVVIVNATRKLSIESLKKLNAYFRTDIRTKQIKYKLFIDLNEPMYCSLTIEDIKPIQVSMFDEHLQLVYNNKITSKLMMNYKLLIDLFEDNEIDDWMFCYIGKDHIGLANKDYTNGHCITCKDINNMNFDNVLKITSTYTEALIMCLKRNLNSSYIGNWNVYKFGEKINK